MRINAYGLSFKLTDAIKRHVERRVRSALGPSSGLVLGARVGLRDTNGTRGGVDKACRAVVRTRGGVVVVDAVDRDLYAAVDAAATKLKKAVGRRLRRRRTPATRARQSPAIGRLTAFRREIRCSHVTLAGPCSHCGR